ncbi:MULTISPECIES: squalene/phytoene synthase family protein [Sphingomonas]|uniref:squalene/phytoene synthase family protein n=1 Tax=Sphingomonas TaxID=13687 RepID=UPI000DEEE48F|nr:MULTISPECIES: squalene/phytoene synthase family protein [Sphingomonas]
MTTDRDLVRLHWPPALRPAFDALFAIDDALAEVVETAREPMLAAIKLAWWRESLEKLDSAPAPAEPRLQAVAAELLPRGVSGAELGRLADGWAKFVELEEPQTFIQASAIRGSMLFALGARLLDPDDRGDWKDAGIEYCATNFARRSYYDSPGQKLGRIPRIPSRLRPISALWALARRDNRRGGPPFEPEATPGRAWTLLRHRLTGR